jgi:hypothetical protein
MQMEVLGYNGNYTISEDGVILSNSGRFLNKEDKSITHSLTDDGYEFIRLSLNYKIKKHFVHRIIAQHFIPNPNGLEQVNHIDGNKRNNVISNLEWCSRQDNMKHAALNNLMQNGSDRPSSKLTEKQAIEIKNSKLSGSELAKIYGVSKNTALLIKRGLKWSYLKCNNA